MSFANNGDCTLFYETFGDPKNPALLLVNGLGSQCINYRTNWCEMFAERDLYVIRFDNRDMGLSTHFTNAPVKDKGQSYDLADMAADCIAVLDAEHIDKAHIMGLSMGGMIVQTVAINHPDRLLSLTSVMSSSGEEGYGAPTKRAFELLTAPGAKDREEYIQQWIDGLHEWGSPEFADDDRWTADAIRSFDRCFDPDGATRQFLAIRAAAPRADKLRSLDIRTLVMHGDKDTLIGPDAGRRVAELIPNARFELIEGMGHDYPPQLWEPWVDMVAGHALSS
ncbi:MAG: alpha/beta hydrolase [Ilumatobacteraceae bacterium]